MKKLTAILTVLCLAAAIVSCRSGSQTTSASTQSTLFDSTSETQKTESTTSSSEGTKKPEKPEFVHPAIAEINEGIEKTLALDSVSAKINSSIFVHSSGLNGSSSLQTFVFNQALTAADMQSSLPELSLETKVKPDGTLADVMPQDSKLYAVGEKCYLSRHGINALLPRSKAEAPSPKEMLSTALIKLPASEEEPKGNITESLSIYNFNFPVAKAKDFVSALESELYYRISERKGEEFELSLSSNVSIDITVNREGYIVSYALNCSFMARFDDNTSSLIQLTVSTEFTDVGGEVRPEAPENAADYVYVNSMEEMPLMLFISSASKMNSLASTSVFRLLGVTRTELDGTKTILLEEAYKNKSLSGGVCWRETARGGIYESDLSERDVYFKDGFYYDAGKKLKYSREDYEALFGGNALSPCAPDISEAKIISAEIESKNLKSYYVTITLEDDDFKRIFKDEIEKAARYVAGENEIWNYTVKNCSLSATVSKDGYIDSFKLAFETEVIVTIGNSKFAFTATVTDSYQFINPGEEATVPAPEGFKNFTEYEKQ